jgi:xylulokinase
VGVDQPRFDDRFINCCHAAPGQWVSLAVMNGAGVSMRWFRDLFGQMEVALARELDVDHYDLLVEQAGRAQPGASGLIYLPYLAAERSPVWDPYARGVFFGLNVGHQRGDVIRSILEGVAMSVRHNVAIMVESLSCKIDRLRIGGGCARSPVWVQIIADVTGLTPVTLRAGETETLGAAVLAGVGTGVYPSFVDARDRTLSLEREYAPRAELAPLYDKMYRLYTQLYDDLRPRFAEAARLLQG